MTYQSDNASERSESAQVQLEKARNWYIDDFVRYITVERNLAKRTVIEYREDLLIFLNYFQPLFEDGLTLGRVDIRTISDFLAYLKLEHNYEASSLNRKIACLKSYFRFLKLYGYISDSPMDKFKSVKEGRVLPKVLSQEEVGKILAYAHTQSDPGGNWKAYRNTAILELFYSTGMRLAELTSLNLSDLNFDDYSIRVTGKGSKQRIVFMNQSTVSSLQAYLAARPNTKDPAVFLNRFYSRLSRRGVEILFDKLKEEAGVFKDASPHTMRHSFATHLLEGGADLVTIKELLGHATLSTTQIYTNLSRTTMRGVYDNSHPRQ
ncbi:MAG: site-specific tyrosine recombinase/integron integrase [Candidatus Bruticola sp.]